MFCESAEWVGLTQSVLSPRIGMEQRHFRLVAPAAAAGSRLHPSPEEAGSVAVVEVIKYPDNRWQVLHAEVSKEHRRRGIARMLYDRVQSALRTTLYPSGWLSDDAYRFWVDRGSPHLRSYRQLDCFKGMWLSPKALLTLRNITVAQMMDWSEDAKAS